jgi:isopenicillin-N N-acyltransferase-like protein
MTTAARYRLYHWSGSPFEIGRQHGAALSDEIISESGPAAHALAVRLNLSLPKALEKVVALYEPLFQEHLPIAVEEIKGIAAGAGLSYPFAFFAATRDGMKVSDQTDQEQCTSFVCGKNTTQNGNVLMGQTKDTGLSTERYHLMRFDYRDGKRLFVLNYPGLIANIALTSDGMAVTGNSLYAKTPDDDTIPYSFLKRLVMERSSVEEFLRAIDGLCFQNGCFIVGDATGRAVCIESVAGQLSIRDVSGCAFGHANSILSKELQHFEDPATCLPSSPLRQKNIQKLLDSMKGHITAEGLKRVAADHTDYPFSICRHPTETDPLSTSASVVMDLSNLEMHVALGKPCRSTFECFKL